MSVDFHVDNLHYIVTGITLFHQGSDALELEFISISTNNGTMYQCQMPDVYVDNSEFVKSDYCFAI